MLIRTIAVCALVILAGCSGVLPGSGTQTNAESGPFTEPGAHPGMAADVDIRNLALMSVHITVTELNKNGRGVVLTKTYNDEVTIEFDDSDVFRENGKYRVTIRANGSVQWNRTVRHFEWYELRIENKGSVTIMTHAMA